MLDLWGVSCTCLSLHCGHKSCWGKEGGGSKSRERCTWDDHTLQKTFSTVRNKCSFLNWGPWGSFFSGHCSLLSVYSDLTNSEFLQVPGMHQILTSRSKAKEKSNLEILILYLLSRNLAIWLNPLHFQDSGYFLQKCPCPHSPALGCLSFEVSPSTHPHCVVTI